MNRKTPEDLRSHRWFGSSDLRQFGHHSRAAQMGYSRADYLGKPIIAILNTWSDINACHSHVSASLGEILTTLPRSRENWRFAAIADNPDSFTKSVSESVTRPKARRASQKACAAPIRRSS